MARFIATNMAATGLRPPPPPPPISNVREWLEPEVKLQDTIPSKSQAIPEPPMDIVDQGMPLPPPPPDISELMTSDDITETNDQRVMVMVSSNCKVKCLMTRKTHKIMYVPFNRVQFQM